MNSLLLLGLTPEQKRRRIGEYRIAHDVHRIVVLSPPKYRLMLGLPMTQEIEWSEIIMYRTFYRLLQEINASTLVVVNECLRTQNRYDLTYNCIRHFLAQAGHVLVCQWLPCIDTMQDFMILFDFATGSRWKREAFDPGMIRECPLQIVPRTPVLQAIEIATDAKTKEAYAVERDKLFASLAHKDPHTLPRQLHLLGGKTKLSHVDASAWYVARNTRLKLPQAQTYKEEAYPHAPYTLFEFPHNFIDLSDVLALAGQERVPALVTDLKVDQWYLGRFTDWTRRIARGYADLLS